jgi:hypothetical protein
MARGIAKQNLPVVVFFGLLAVSLGGLLLLPPVPQDQSYHQFADQRTIFGIPNFWNVVSNLPFVAAGAAGFRRFRDDPATVVFFLGVFLTGIGSSYYHWDPNDGTLFWDRLPMTLSFAALLALVVEERVNARAGAILLWPALAIGLLSLLLWRWTDDRAPTGQRPLKWASSCSTSCGTSSGSMLIWQRLPIRSSRGAANCFQAG